MFNAGSSILRRESFSRKLRCSSSSINKLTEFFVRFFFSFHSNFEFLDTARYPMAFYVYQEKPPIYKVLSNGEIHDVPAVTSKSYWKSTLVRIFRFRAIIICWIHFFSLSNVLIQIATDIWGSFRFKERRNFLASFSFRSLNLGASGADILWTITPPTTSSWTNSFSVQ